MQSLLGLLYPRRCPFCDAVLGQLPECPDCMPRVQKLRHQPPRLSPGEHSLMALTGAASACHYCDEVASAIRLCKYAGHPWYARELGRLTARWVLGYTFENQNGIIVPLGTVDYSRAYDIIVPVPSSGGLRGYNPSVLIARELSRASGIPLQANALCKIRRTPPQASLNRQQRLTNLIGAFTAEARQVEGRRVLLVDDVITTGATVSVCAIALAKGGAAEVFAISVAAAEDKQNKGVRT